MTQGNDNPAGQKAAGHDPGEQNATGTEPKVQQNKEAVERVVSGLAGAAFEGIESVGNGIAALWNFNKSVLNTAGQITEPLLKPLDALGVTEMVRRPVDAVVTGVEVRVAQLEVKGREGLTQTGSITILAISDTIDAVLDYISTHPQVDKLITDKLDKFLPLLSESAAVQKLVRKQVDAILPTLVKDPTIQLLIREQADTYLDSLATTLNPKLQALVRQQGDDYIEYLNAHPEPVQYLIQGQTIGMTNQIMDEVRERAVTADSVVEMIVRRVLGRKQREQLPPPPPEVQRRADVVSLASDFVGAAPQASQQAPGHSRNGDRS
jgi:hypothetical protein